MAFDKSAISLKNVKKGKKRVARVQRKRYVNKALKIKGAKRSLKTEQESTEKNVNLRKRLTKESARESIKWRV